MDVSPLLLALASGLALLVVVFGLYQLSQPGIVQQRLDQFGVLPHNLEELELQQPFKERIARPIYRTLSSVIIKRTPQSTIDQIRRDLIVAGSPGDLDVRDFIGIKGLAALGMGLFGYLFTSRGMAGVNAIIVPLALIGLGFYFPQMWLKGRIKTRKHQIQLALPDALDLLTICVEAGLGFDQALHKVTEKWQNALSREFGRVLSEIRMGKSRRDALRDMIPRTDVPDVATFIAAIVQADQLGVSIGNVLVSQAEQMRVKRRQRAEELAHEAPVKMIFPMVLLIFPALWVIILGPALPSLVGSLGAR